MKSVWVRGLFRTVRDDALKHYVRFHQAGIIACQIRPYLRCSSEPEPISLHTKQIRELIDRIILEGMTSQKAGILIRTQSAELPEADQCQFIEIMEIEYWRYMKAISPVTGKS